MPVFVFPLSNLPSYIISVLVMPCEHPTRVVSCYCHQLATAKPPENIEMMRHHQHSTFNMAKRYRADVLIKCRSYLVSSGYFGFTFSVTIYISMLLKLTDKAHATAPGLQLPMRSIDQRAGPGWCYRRRMTSISSSLIRKPVKS